MVLRAAMVFSSNRCLSRSDYIGAGRGRFEHWSGSGGPPESVVTAQQRQLCAWKLFAGGCLRLRRVELTVCAKTHRARCVWGCMLGQSRVSTFVNAVCAVMPYV